MTIFSLLLLLAATLLAWQRVSLSGSPPRLLERYRSSLATLLERAGREREEVGNIFRVQLLSAGALLTIGLFFQVDPLVLLPVSAIVGIHPRLLLHRRVRLRHRALVRALPTFLDLLTLALEAGHDLVAATDEILRRHAPGPLRDELLLALRMIRMGRPRSLSFQSLAERTAIEPLRQLTASIQQSEELGAALSPLLRRQAEGLRRAHFREAEERAQKAPLRMLIPLLGLVFPVVLVLLLAPALILLFSATYSY